MLAALKDRFGDGKIDSRTDTLNEATFQLFIDNTSAEQHADKYLNWKRDLERPTGEGGFGGTSEVIDAVLTTSFMRSIEYFEEFAAAFETLQALPVATSLPERLDKFVAMKRRAGPIRISAEKYDRGPVKALADCF